MTAVFWLAVSLGLLWGYVRIGRAVGMAAGRRSYERGYAHHKEQWPILGDRDAHRWGQRQARETYLLGRIVWPLALCYLFATRNPAHPLDFSPDGRVVQERIKELERQLGMPR